MRSFLLIIPALLFIKNLDAQQPEYPFTPPIDKKIEGLLPDLKRAGEDTNKVNILEKLYHAYTINENYSEAAKYNNEALQLAKKLGYINGEARCMVNKAFECQREKKWGEILNYSLPAAEILKQTNDTYTKARCITITGYAYYYNSIYPETIKCFLEAVMYWKELKNDKAIITLSFRLSECFEYMGNYILAFEKGYEALELSIKIGDKYSEARGYQHTSSRYLMLKKYKKAKETVEKALKINKALGETFQYAQNQNALAEISIEENNFSEAKQYILAAMKIYEAPGSPEFGKQWCYTLLGLVNEDRGDSAILKNNEKYAIQCYQDALKDLTTALNLCEGINNKVFFPEKYIYLGRVYRKLHNNSLSRTYLLKAIPLVKELSLKQLTTEGYRELSSLDSMEGNFKSAFENSKLYKIYNDSLALEMEKGKTESFIIQAEMNKKEEEIKVLSAENKLKSALAQKQEQQKIFAYAGIAVVIILSWYGFYRYRRRKKMEMLQAQLKDRLQISQGLHDNIGSTLSSISVYSQVAQKLSEKNEIEEMSEMLGKISETSNEMVSEMNDIVWAINPKNDSMERIIQRMESFAKPILATRNISFNLHFQPSILTASLDMEKRKNLYLIFKETINNAFKYSGCSEIKTIISNSNKQIKMTIKDNGVGFDVKREIAGDKLSLSGNGLRNMRSRTEEMKGELLVESIPGEGTQIELSIPIP